MSTATSALTVACAKPNCHWKGPPADAPAHVCPTPAAGVDVDPFAGMGDIHGEPIADAASVARALPYRVIWTSGDGTKTVVIGTAATETDAAKIVAQTDAGKGTVAIESSFLQDDQAVVAERDALFAKLDDAGVTYDRGTSIDGLRELVALTTGEVIEPDAPAYDADPTSRDDLEAWLGAHGAYDARGVPTDEKTATLDARYAVYLEDEREEPDLEDEPEPIVAVEPPTAPQGFAADADPPYGDDSGPTDADLEIADALENEELGGPRAWQTVIADELDEQPGVKEHRWLIVWHPADGREAELIGRGKVKHEAVVVQEDVIARGQLVGEVVVVKTADVLAAAEKIKADAARADAVTEWDDERLAGVAASDHTLATAAKVEIERRRELVTEPDKTVTEEDKPDGKTPAPEKKGPGEQTEALAAPKTPPPGAKPALFDASDFDRADLALPQVDGHPIDRIAVKFGGSIMLDRSNPDHVALWRRLKLGRKTELWVEAKGLGFTGKGATNKDGELDVVVGERSVTIENVRILGAEDLGGAAAEIAAQARDALEAEDARSRVPADA